MIELQIDKPLSLEFKLDIDNNTEIPKVNLAIEIDEITEFTFIGSVNNDIATVTIPRLEKYSTLIESKLLKARLEVITDGRIFYPWDDSFSVIKEIKVLPSSVKVEKAIKPKPLRVDLQSVKEIVEPTVITIQKKIKVENLQLVKGDKLNILSENREGYTAITHKIDIGDIRLEKGDYVAKSK